MAAGDKLVITLFKMHPLNMSLVLGIFNATMGYLFILVQFDIAYKRTK